MTKKRLRFSEGVSFLAPVGTLDDLRAVAYFRGKKGKLGEGAREVHVRGMDAFMASLSQAERVRFNSILESVRLAARMK